MPINNLNKNIVLIKFGDDKKINRKVKRKTKPKARQQKPLIISSGGSIPYAPQIQNLHYNKKSDDYFKDSLAAREKHDAILNAVLKRHNELLNNVNTKTVYSNPLSNNIDTQIDNSLSNNIDTQIDNSLSNNIDTQIDNLL